MEYYFDTKERYIAFLENLSLYCDTVAIQVEDGRVNSEDIESIMHQKSKIKWMREFPGYGKLPGKAKEEVLLFPFNNKVLSAFTKYDSFLTVGYNPKTKLGVDMAFYKENDLVFYVIRHEDMCYLEKDYQQYFGETIQKYSIKPRWG